MPKFGASHTVINYAPRIINYAPRIINYAPREHIYSRGITHDDRNMLIVQATSLKGLTITSHGTLASGIKIL
jgi:hypothetical protein